MRVRAALVALVGVVGWGALAGSASAAPLNTQLAPTGGVGGNGLIKATAKCLPGERVVSGGYAAPDEVYAYVNKAKGKSAWTAALEPEEPGDSATVFAYCSPKLKVDTHSKAVKVKGGSGERGNATARCPNGRTAAAGGHEIVKPKDNLHEGVAFASFRKGSSKWAVSAFNENDSKFKLKSIAYCLGGKAVAVSKGTGNVSANSSGSANATCDAGKDLLGGGYKTSPKPDFDNQVGPDLFYDASFLSGPATWTADSHNYSTVQGIVTAFAYCR